MQLATLQALARYWTTEYDWRKCEARLNALPQFTTEIDGVEIHFIHVRSRHENALPLIMTHGWPGSVIELLDTVGPLTDPTAHGGTPEDAFHLVLPSLPGYGFSGEPAELGWESGRIARAWAELMDRLGYTRYVAQGGDVGANVTDAMGRQGPEGLVGIHVSLLSGALAIKDQLPAESEQERAALEALNTFTTDGFGYFLEQSTRPQTIGYSLLDSPVGLAAWMLDHDTDSYYKMSRAFVDGEPVGNLTRETIVDNITLYWLTGTGASAARWYWEFGRFVAAAQASGQAPPPVTVPVGFTTFPGEIWAAPRSWVEAVYPGARVLQRGRPRRPLRRLGGAGALLRRGAGRVQLTALTTPSCSQHVHMPSLGGATEWLNSEPLGPAELRGHVVLVNFWTWTCINWLRQEPYVRAWSQAYRDDGLVVIGVHTPEFSFEHDIEGVRQATKERAIDYPVAVDNDYEIWSAFANHYWPALYFVDADGIIRDQHFGEGRYEQSERVIQRLLGVERELVSVEGVGVEAAADWDHLLYPRDVSGLTARRALEPLDARRRVDDRARERRARPRPAGASPSGSTRATRTSCSRPERERRFPSACFSTVSRRARRTVSTSTRTGPAFCGQPHVPARAPARRRPRPDAGDHVSRARRRGVRVHVRVASWPPPSPASRPVTHGRDRRPVARPVRPWAPTIT